jgi:hypothetical protein
MKPATASRAYEFCAGPGTYIFHACPDHRPILDKPLDLFLVLKSEDVKPVSPDDGIECDFCREG